MLKITTRVYNILVYWHKHDVLAIKLLFCWGRTTVLVLMYATKRAECHLVWFALVYLLCLFPGTARNSAREAVRLLQRLLEKCTDKYCTDYVYNEKRSATSAGKLMHIHNKNNTTWCTYITKITHFVDSSFIEIIGSPYLSFSDIWLVVVCRRTVSDYVRTYLFWTEFLCIIPMVNLDIVSLLVWWSKFVCLSVVFLLNLSWF